MLGVEPMMILRLAKVSVRLSANLNGLPSAVCSMASASSSNQNPGRVSAKVARRPGRNHLQEPRQGTFG